MKNSLSTLLLLLFPSFAVAQDAGAPPAVPEFDTSSPETYGLGLATFVERYDEGWKDEVYQGVMTLFDARGDSVRRTFTRMGRENIESGDKLLIRFQSPAEIKGVSALTFENPGSSDDNWLYLPANKRVRRVSGANNTASFQGTEFTYEDLSSIDPVEYEWRYLGTGDLKRDGVSEPVFEVRGRPTYSDTGYSHIVIHINQTKWRIERVEYFDKAGSSLKTRDASNWNLIHDRFWRARTVEMKNHQTGKRTKLEEQRIFVNLSLYKSSKTGKARPNLSEELFTTRALQS